MTHRQRLTTGCSGRTAARPAAEPERSVYTTLGLYDDRQNHTMKNLDNIPTYASQ